MANRVAKIPYSLQVETAASDYPITVAELKTELLISTDSLDTWLGQLIGEASEHLEAATGRALLDATYIEYFDDWPLSVSQAVTLHRAPVDSVTSIKYLDTSGNEQTLADTNYDVDVYAAPCRIALAEGGTLPALQADTINRVYIEYVAGYGTQSDVPEVCKEFVRTYCRPRYEARSATREEVDRINAIVSGLIYEL